MKERQIARFWAQVEKTEGCWFWFGAANDRGYGVAWDGWRTRLAHRMAWFLTNGSYPELCLCHSCDTPNCVNPAHLFEGTRAENLADMRSKGRAAPMPRKRGEAHHFTPFTEDTIRAIRATGRPGVYSALARAHGVSPQAIRNICLRKSWRHVP